MDIQGRTQPSYRPRGTEENNSQTPVVQPSGAIDGVSAPTPTAAPQQQQNVISGGAVPQTHQSDDVALERIMQDVRRDPRLAPDKPNEKPAEAPVQKQTDTTQKKHSRMPIIVAIAALLIAGGLAVTAYFAFSGNRAEENGNKIINQVSSPKDAEATPESVDQTSEEIGQEVDTLQDTQDFNEADLGDQQLGL